ncbi:hypothetical protein ACFL54_09365, partial [Planctomycetota bacterium]
RLSGIVNNIIELQANYSPGTPDDEIGAAQNNSLAVEQINIRQMLENTSFGGENLIAATEVMEQVMNAENLQVLGDSPQLLSRELAVLRQDNAEDLKSFSGEMAKAQVTMENINSLNSPQSTDEMNELLVQISGSLAAQDSTEALDLDRQNILSLLGGPSE